MAEEKVKKREWVKNAAIIFLSIMLVLTFFSNTFLLRSLPEVSTQSVSSGTINTKIRGSGTVAANQTYNVTLEQNRKVDSILVKVGQKVNAGDVLFTLQEGDSKELEAAKDALYDAEVSYRKAIINADTGENYRAEKAALSDAQRSLKESKDEYRDLIYKLNNEQTGKGAVQNKINEAKKAVAEAQKAYNDALDEYNAAKKAKYDEFEALTGSTPPDEPYRPDEVIKYVKLYYEAKEKMEECRAKGDTLYEEVWKTAMDEYEGHLALLVIKAEGGTDLARMRYDELQALENEYSIKKESLSTTISTAESTLAKLNKELEVFAEYETKLVAVKKDIENKEIVVSNATDALQDKIAADVKAGKLQDIDFEVMKRDLEKKKKTVEDLSGNNGGNEVTAKVGGTISEINVKAGSEAPAQDALMVIELTDRGYTVSITATAEQAKKVSVGDTAEVSAYWWGSEIKATLESIKNDPSSGGKNKLLVFTLSGDVEPGQNVNLSIGQKSQNYDSIVPKSAVRSDTNGKFVLVLTQKSSPIGNRYVATRVDVKVLAEDDVSAAVTGLSYGDYVITTSSKPIEAGTLVRMAEGA